MAYKDILPTTNLTVSDVRDTIGESTNDIGRLCKSTKINKWARYKPVEGEWPHGGGDYDSVGYSIPYTTGWLGNSITELSKQWVYKPATTKFRLGDFRGYVHTAPEPIAITLPKDADKNQIFSIIYSDYSIYLDVFEKFIANNPSVKPCLGLYVFNKDNMAQYVVVSALFGDDLWFSFRDTNFSVGATLGTLIFLTDRVIPFAVGPAQPVMGLCMSARPLPAVTYKEYELYIPSKPSVDITIVSLSAHVEKEGVIIVDGVSLNVTAPSVGGYTGGSYTLNVFVEGDYIGDAVGNVAVGSTRSHYVSPPAPVRAVVGNMNFSVSAFGQNATCNQKVYIIDGFFIVEVE